MLPDHGSTQLNKKRGYNIQKSGFYVLRNNREIAAAQLLGLNSLSRPPTSSVSAAKYYFGAHGRSDGH